MANNIPVSVDYTNRDFYSFRDDLISRVQTRVLDNGKTWTATDPADFGVALVEAFSFIGDTTNYYIDRIANESYIQTATNRQSLLDLAQLIGYIPSGYRQSQVTLTFSNSSTSTPVIVPGGTEVTVNITTSDIVSQLIFTVQDDVSVPAATSSTSPGISTGTAFHGRNAALLPSNAASLTDTTDMAGELLGYSNGLPNQSFNLANTPVVDGTVFVYVNNGNNYIPWTKVDHLPDYGPLDTVYSVTSDANGYYTVTFGDGISGAIPTISAPIKARYVIGGGLVGNIEASQNFIITAVPVASGQTLSSLTSISVYTSGSAPATGGEDPESNNSIRVNAPASLRTLKRAVTLQDYQDLTKSVIGVGKAYAKAVSPGSVTVYMGITVSDNSQDYYPGFDVTNTVLQSSWTSVKSSVATYLSDKVQIGTTVTIIPPTYVPVKAVIQYNKTDSYSHDQIYNGIKQVLVYYYGYNYLDFNRIIYPEQVESSLMAISGVLSLKAISLYRASGSASRTTLVPTNGEYFVFRDENVTVYPNASVSSIIPSSGTLSTSFKSYLFNYAINTVTTSTITLAATLNDTSYTATFNGAAPASVVSGVATSSAISTPTGATTTITVVITSADTLTSNTYTLTVTR